MPYYLFHNSTALSTADIQRVLGFFLNNENVPIRRKSDPDTQKYSLLPFCAGNVPLFMKLMFVSKPMDSVEKKIHLIGQGWNNVFLRGNI